MSANGQLIPYPILTLSIYEDHDGVPGLNVLITWGVSES